jgi:hypothetical protein
MSVFQYIASDYPLKSFGEIRIRAFNKDDMRDDIYTEKKYCACLEWVYAESGAEKLIQYIRRHLTEAEEIELWNIWLGERFDESKPRIKTRHIDQLDEWFDGFTFKMKTNRIPVDQLTCSDLEKVFNRKNVTDPERITVTQK